MHDLENNPIREFDYDYILIDGMNLAYRNYHTIPVKFGGKRSGLFFGFMSKAVNYRKQYPKAKIIVLWEGDGQNCRKSLLPTYKGNRINAEHRSEIPNDFQENLHDVRRALSLVGVYQASYPSLEADDLAHFYCLKVINPRKRALLVTNDTDWYEFLRPNSVFIEDKHGTISHEKAYERLRHDPAKMALFKSVRGCKTDYVEQAIDRIGDQKLAELVERSDDLMSLIRNMKDNGLVFNEEMVRVNHSVVSFYGEIVAEAFHDLDIVKPNKNDDKLKNILLKWGCFSLLDWLGMGSAIHKQTHDDFVREGPPRDAPES